MGVSTRAWLGSWPASCFSSLVFALAWPFFALLFSELSSPGVQDPQLGMSFAALPFFPLGPPSQWGTVCLRCIIQDEKGPCCRSVAHIQIRLHVGYVDATLRVGHIVQCVGWPRLYGL